MQFNLFGKFFIITQNFLSVFNNREKAVLVWIIAGIVFLLLKKETRKSIFDLIYAFLKVKILVVLFLMVVYVVGVIFCIQWLHLWNAWLLKDSIIWLLGTGFIMVLNFDKASNERGYFKKVILDNLKFIVLLEFITNLYVFSLIFELIFVPILFIIGGMLGLSKSNEKYENVRKVLNYTLLIIGIFLISYSFASAIKDFQNFFTIRNLKDLLLPPLLTITFLPFVYGFALLSTYELLFIRLDATLKNRKLANFTKWRIITTSLINLKKLNKFSKNLAPLLIFTSKSDVINWIENINAKF